jgi:hypothetical protein
MPQESTKRKGAGPLPTWGVATTTGDHNDEGGGMNDNSGAPARTGGHELPKEHQLQGGGPTRGDRELTEQRLGYSNDRGTTTCDDEPQR